MDIKFAGAVYNSEQFNTAGRSIGTGLLAVDIVSHWTWASILLTSVSYGYFYGITGSYWCAADNPMLPCSFPCDPGSWHTPIIEWPQYCTNGQLNLPFSHSL